LDEYFDADPFASLRKPGLVRCLICGRQFSSVDVRTNRVCPRTACQERLKEDRGSYRVRR
jgi:hypothetical protein